MNFNPAEFVNPSAAWRGKPFWSWNGKLDTAELIRQIHVLKEMGMGGFFMHSRTGLVTQYLGDEWFDLINACADEGERLGMEGWLYDEDRWPSGTAGGMVTANPDFRMKFIHMQVFDGNTFDFATWRDGEDRPLGAWSCRLENKADIHDVAPVTDATSSGDLAGRTVLAFRIIPMAGGSFYNGNTYVDTLKRDATDEYLRVTHEAYKQHCGRHFGKGIKGIFTDEPHRGPFMSGFGATAATAAEMTQLVPWTDSLFDTFERMHGTRLEKQLPSLFYRPKGAEITPVKWQYSETVLSLFLDNFAKPCLDWCRKNNLILTGHVLHENSLACQVSTIGSVQRYYPLMDWPGIDYLGEHGRDYWVAKQVDSTARQFGQPWILSELYGCTGWQMNFESHKAVGAWQALFGVNVRCHHLSWYTMAGESKRDYPASIFHQSAWYREYELVETWFSRLGYFRSQGAPCCDLLVLNSVESVWGRMYPGAIKGMQAIDPQIQSMEKEYAKLFHILAGNQIDFDYGDEALLAEHAAIVREGGAARIRVGQMTYTTLLIAGVETIRGATLKLLTDFAAAGGRVVFAGDAPAYVDARPSRAAQEVNARRCPFEDEAVCRALNEHTSKRVSIIDSASGTTARAIFCQLREAADAHYLTVLNSDRDRSFDLTISVSGIDADAVEEWDLTKGKANGVQLEVDGGIRFSTTLHTSDVRCFRIVRSSPLAVRQDARKSDVARTIALAAPCTYTLADQNVLVLDTASWTVNGGVEQGVDDILRIDQNVRRGFGVAVRSGDMVQPWFRGKEPFPVLGKVQLRYRLSVDAEVMSMLDSCELVLETPDRFRVTINGTPVSTAADEGWWVDQAFRRIRLPAGLFRAGENQIVVACDFSEDLNLEAIYLRGEFAVDLGADIPRLKPLPDVLQPVSVVDQGLPYYSDSITYHYPVPAECVGTTATVEVPAYEGAFVKISSAGQSRLIPWRPNVATLQLGESLDIQVCLTRKNTFGPLHLTTSRPRATGPHSFLPGPEMFSLKPVFIESGLLAPPKLRLYADA